MATNPYAPPSARVSDISSVSEEVQEIRLWSAKGRIGRLRYLAYTFGSSLILSGIGGGVMAALGPTVGGIVYSILYIPLIFFAAFSGIKRSHDMNWSGWTLLILFVSAIGLGVAAVMIPNNPSMGIVALIALILSLSGLIWVFKKGTEGSNDYGAPPPPNTTGVKILGYIFPVIFVVGMLAAIALPAYQQYVKRAQEAQQGK